ncbi:hypothetical protein GCM10027418_06480 [Mariniluteicoccus endophyticus]
MTTSRALLFLDTETTSLTNTREPWEIAMIRRDPDGTETTRHLFVDADLTNADPASLDIGGYYRRHPIGRWLAAPTTKRNRPDFGIVPVHPDRPDSPQARFVTRAAAAAEVARMTHNSVPVGVRPAFDLATLDALLARHRLIPQWHRPIDVRDLAVGYLAARGQLDNINPADSNTTDIVSACGLTTWADKHTALGDALLARTLYDTLLAPVDTPVRFVNTE